RTFELIASGLLVHFFDSLVALRSAGRCAALVERASSLSEANDILLAHGMSTELAYEAAHASARE
ncbi:MAG: hypothetical protein ACR2LK_11395, partial [Solirubrobacteraceae bacterium]